MRGSRLAYPALVPRNLAHAALTPAIYFGLPGKSPVAGATESERGVALAAARFAITGDYELTGAQAWQYASGVCRIVAAGLAAYCDQASSGEQVEQRACHVSPRSPMQTSFS